MVNIYVRNPGLFIAARFSFFKTKPPAAPRRRAPCRASLPGSLIGSALVTPIDIPWPEAAPPERAKWLGKLKAGLGKTRSSISTVFTGAQIDEALQLTGLIVTKLDGTAKGGVLAAIAQERPIPVYFIGVGEKLDDPETFNVREFAQALLS